MNSLRRQLLVWQISALLVTGLLAGVITYLLVWDGFNRTRDYGLEQIAYSVVRHGVDYENTTREHEDLGQFVSQIWSATGESLYSSLPDIGPPPQQPGWHVVEWHDMRWRVFTHAEGGLVIQVASSIANRARYFARIVPWLLIPLVILVVLLGLLIHTAVGHALKPLEKLRAEIGLRGALRMHALDVRGMPEEVAPLVATLNELLARLDDAMIAQRRFIADAAHELRTPLAAVRLQAQLVDRSEDEAARKSALSQLLGGIDRASHLVQQLLSMARLEPSARDMIFRPVRLDLLAKQTVIDFSAQAEAQDVDLGAGDLAPVEVGGDPDSLRVMLDNLIDNALRYVPAGGRVDVNVRSREGFVILEVDDNGPGIPADQRERVFERFQRLDSEIPGSGLGLAIVRRIATLHCGHVDLDDSPQGGLSVRVSLPIRTPPRHDARFRLPPA
jgi:signal transduction histidine kinase